SLEVSASGSRTPKHELGNGNSMRKFLICFGAALLLVLPQGKFTTAPLPNQETKDLKKRHKKQRKMVKQQQRAMKKVMGQHEQTSDSRERFKHDLRMQR